MKETILVTGASSGFGFLLASKLHKNGYNVIGTSRNPEKYSGTLPFKMIALDLDSEQSINTFPERIFKEIRQLDILVNNAGFLVSGIAEETPIELGRQQLETNFWGTVKVTNAVLPYLRKKKSGKIITVGSIIGLVSFPNAAYYAASKHALEGYFKSLRYELNEFNISVAMIEPSAFKTSILNNSSSSLTKIEDYNTLRGKIEKFTNDLAERAEDPAIVIEKVLQVIQKDKPKFRNMVGKGTTALVNLQHFAYGMLEKGVLKQLNRF
ncbi:SDR family NAD(P)-dependent oxidoreductase [Terrimonas sp. NA20]|uniref:SDR family NAD(P)-dependent oxidoreductase n=1 Tax=Terrimonas ginsenosidimutans TaxID=2908004 RepID=A0ABS9KP59_9BACT|nr:SDR family NAD(P)-dependent oxidoreductase [Terrimonas ginsenosidimutans]MCG2614117.1 SDR family NAD(P)-dependent oxidoreductase [Terrimonas ginsenosidimutans]